MRNAESLHGTGRLHVNGEDLGSVTYSVTLTSECDPALGNGVLSGNERAIAAAGVYGAAGLALESGGLIDIHVHAANMTRGLFIVSGPIPGF